MTIGPDSLKCVSEMYLADTEANLEFDLAAASPESNPISENRSGGTVINAIHTDIVVQNYRNRMFLILSQYKKIGSLITVTREEAAKTDVYTIKTILGKDDDETHVAARYIAEQMAIVKPLLISICLKDYSVETLRHIIAAIEKLQSI